MAVQEIGTVREPTRRELDALNARFSGATPQEILRWADDEFGEGLVMACSFGGISGMAILDMVVKIRPDIDVFYLDTDFLFPETLSTRDRAIARYGINPVPYRPVLNPQQQAAKYGEALWLRDPDKCCAMRKVEPNTRALEGRSAWIAGLRRDQASTRRSVEPVMWDVKFGLYKIAPLAHWDEKQVWRYIFENDVPYNPLHDQGYPSLGCTNCTRPAGVEGDERSGRWSGTGKTECGLHK